MDVLALAVDETDERLVPAWRQALDEAEAAQADRFHRAADRVRYIAAHALLRSALGAATGRAPASLRFGRGGHGKPFLPEVPGLHFNLTHTAGLVAVALCGSPIGCDAELVDRPVRDAVHTMMAGEEAAWLRGLAEGDARRRGFVRLWVVKEAYVKALGCGLALDPRSYCFDVSGPAIRLVWTKAEQGVGWVFAAHCFGERHAVGLAAAAGLLPAPRAVTGEDVAAAATGGTAMVLRPVQG